MNKMHYVCLTYWTWLISFKGVYFSCREFYHKHLGHKHFCCITNWPYGNFAVKGKIKILIKIKIKNKIKKENKRGTFMKKDVNEI